MQFLLTKNIINDGDSIFIFDFSEVKKELEHVTAFEVQGEDITMYLDNYLSRKPNGQELALIEDILAKYKELKESTKLDRAKALKLYELAQKAQSFEDSVNKSMYFISSVFVEKESQKDDETTETVKEHLVINGDRRTRSNLEDLIIYGTTDTIQFRDYNNTMREVTKDQLKNILKENVINGQNMYYQKWAYEEQIKACTTIEELNAIELNFVMKDFSK